MRNIRPSYYRYPGFAPAYKEIFSHTKNHSQLRVFVWPSRKAMQKATWGRNTMIKRNRPVEHFECQALFCSKYDDRSRWIGDLHFYRQKIKLEWIAHEVTHAAACFWRKTGRRLHGRNEELFAQFVGQVIGTVTKNLLDKKLKFSIRL